MNNPYSDRMMEIARLRNQRMVIDSQIDDEIAKAWRLAPVNNLTVFAFNLGIGEDELRRVLESRGIIVRVEGA